MVEDDRKSSQDILFLAVINNQAEVIEYLIKEKLVKPEKEYLSKLLYRCVRYGRAESAEKLLSFGADVNYRTPEGDTLLHSACELFMYGSIELILGKFHDGESITTKTERIVRLLLKNNVDQTLKSDTISKILLPQIWKTDYYKLADEIKDVNVRDIIQKLIIANRVINEREKEPPSPSTIGIFKKTTNQSGPQLQPSEDQSLNNKRS